MSIDPRYRAWLCDLDGTLYHAGSLKLIMALNLALFGWSDIRTIRAFRLEHEHLRKRTKAGVQPTRMSPFAEQLARAAEKLGLPQDEVLRSVERWMIEQPCRWLARFRRENLIAELAEFRAEGGKTALVSDYPARRKLEALGLQGMFDVVVANGEPEGPAALKPAADGYLKAAAALGVEPALCLVIGDREDADGEAARAAGMGFRLIR